MAEHDDTSGQAAVPRIIDRLRAAGLSEDRIQQRFHAGAIRLDGQQVAALDQHAGRPGARPRRRVFASPLSRPVMDPS